jgi:hypothetical protein
MFSWDELTSVYDSMLHNCQRSADTHTREFANQAEGMLTLIHALRGLPDFAQVNLWISQDALVINPSNSTRQIRIWYEADASYVIQSYSPILDETAEVRAAAEHVAARIEHYLKRH